MSTTSLPRLLLLPGIAEFFAVPRRTDAASPFAAKILRRFGVRLSAALKQPAITAPDWWTIDVLAVDTQPARCCSSPCLLEFCYCLACA